MKNAALKAIATSRLVALFAELGVQQDQAELMEETRKFNDLYDKCEAVEAELKGRPGDQRRELMSLYGHSKMQVRFNAAMATLLVAPEEARRELEAIRESKWFPPAANAAMILEGLDDGTFTPT